MADDLTQILRDLNHMAISHRVTYYTDPDDGRAYRAYVNVIRPHIDAVFVWNGHWDLDVAFVNNSRETITGLLASIREA